MESYRQRLNDIWGSDFKDTSLALRWINQTVECNMEEDLYIEFKQKSKSRNPDLSDDDKANLARAISGFANTDGGLVIWGVEARAGKKEEPDVAAKLLPINNLKKFQTRLNDLCGQLVNPPVAGVENRAVPKASNKDTGFVITVVPKRRDTLTEANSKTCKGFYIRSGSGFYRLSQPFIAEFYRRKPSPILRLCLELAEPDTTEVVEELTTAQHYKHVRPRCEEPWGLCTFRQHLALKWDANLKNDGLGSAHQVALDLRISPLGEWSIITSVVEPRYYYLQGQQLPIYPPTPTVKFQVVESNQAVGKVIEPIHPGQKLKVASGVLKIPVESLEKGGFNFKVSGVLYAEDSSYFSVGDCVKGTELQSRYLQAFREKAKPATRKIPEPPGWIGKGRQKNQI